MKSPFKIIIAMLLLILCIGVFSFFNASHQAERVNNILPSSVFTSEANIETIILESFRAGSVEDLLPLMGEELTVKILSEEDFYTPSETLALLDKFFQKYPPKELVKKHGGSTQSGEREYFIIQYIAETNDSFRCTFAIHLEKIASIEISRDTLSAVD